MPDNKCNIKEQNTRCQGSNHHAHFGKTFAIKGCKKCGWQKHQYQQGNNTQRQAGISQLQAEFLGIGPVIGIGDACILHQTYASANEPDGFNQRGPV